MDERQQQSCISMLIAVLVVFGGHATGTTTVNIDNKIASTGETTILNSSSIYTSPDNPSADEDHCLVVASDLDENKSTVIKSLLDPPLFPASTEINSWTPYETSWIIVSDLNNGTTSLNSQTHQLRIILTGDEFMPAQYQLYNQQVPIVCITPDTEFLAAENVTGEGAAMSPPFLSWTSGEGDSSYTTFDVVGDAEPISSLPPVISAPMAILLAGLSAALITWSRHRRAM